uniref:Uncharacterized protein n=1 Tax=Leptocylindrus danicus TaxID=163516 RepID=A0A7S2NVW8_9STRA|mmetsp:Transcript_15131/g.22319  ORF Transcript_15131/g.22319 Transcript_15131/m.22319 type:complete len:444 (+) Transcript_15131:675-2006(+)
MIVQRLIQDFQLVPQDIIAHITRKYGEIGWKNKRQMPSNMNGNPMGRAGSTSFLQRPNSNSGIQYALSMGHRIHTLSYNESTEDIEVVQYQAVETKNYLSNMQSYQYMIWVPLSESFQKDKQRFEKFKYEYRWNKLDNMLCGDPEKSMTEDSRYRRVSFGLIPDSNMSEEKETEYIHNFQLLLNYLNKQIGEDAEEQIYIKVVRTSDSKDSSELSPGRVENKRRNASQSHRSMNRMKRYTIKLSKGKEKYQWMVIVMGASFYTKRSYHISFHWLVASGSKIDAQVQMLKRRCSQYGLRLITFPQYSKSANLRLHPLISPVSVLIEETEVARKAESVLTTEFNFIDDGSLIVEASDVQLQVFEFQVDRWGRQKLTARQFVHHTGCVFVRVLEDARGAFGFFWIDNRKLTRDSELMTQTAQKLYQDFRAFVDCARAKFASGQMSL